MKGYFSNVLFESGTLMNIAYLLIIIVGCLIGLLSTLYLIVSMIGVIFYKIYRKIKFNISLFN